MKKAYLITYNLKYKYEDQLLEKELKKYEKWWHYLDRTWIIVSEETPKEIWNRIGNKINKSNYLLIIEVKKNSDGWLSKSAWGWIKKNVENQI